MTGCNPKHFNLQDDPFELFLLSEGEKRIEEKVYSGMSNTSDFILNKEDHTLGNLLSEHIKAHPNVYMAGYKLGHPNVPQLFIRVQTDGTKTPREVFTAVCEKLINQLESLHQEFTREWELRRITNTGEQGNMQGSGF
ncbi:DNA-directed RNA polymerase II subunit RPB11 [Metarhizium guizhouense ARSEF 977]|uniref:DNA-directed RNA polymerase II subunit RPB11 n=1 Tax=Metarhizium guizhouense (strain ARSEF 977) TaxID=1276136 RepID=A0A0B4HXE5_METGA|nr:DNA-directed RNA polymerase II subunit RPB11 [Metarhizium guizhouense ARSEF 977]